MNNKHPFNPVLIGMVCLSLLTGVTFAQQPFDPLPKPAKPVPPTKPVTEPDQEAPLLVRPQDGPPPQPLSAPRDRDPAQENPLLVRPQDDVRSPKPFSAPQDRDRSQDQSVVVDTRYAGWEEAGLGFDGNRISNQLRGSWIMVDSNGRFEGVVTPAIDADIADMNVFLLNTGRLVEQTRADALGRFEFNNVRRGAYSLVGWGPNGFFAFGLNILENNPNSDGSILNSIEVMAYQNKSTINTDWIRYYAPGVKFRVFGRYPTAEGRDDPPALFGFDGLETHMPESIPASSISSRAVTTTPDGRLVGRVHQFNSLNGRPVELRSTKVMMLEGDEVVAQTKTDYFGWFEFQQVPSGTYGLAAVSVDGVGMITINVDSGDLMNEGELAVSADNIVDFTLTSSETIGWLNNYATDVAYKRALLAPRPLRMDPNVCPNCQNQGCQHCQNQLRNYCDSRGITFEQWNANCYQPGVKYGYGNGTIAAAFVRYNRELIGRSDRLTDRAFYPGEYNGQYSNQQYYYGFGNQPSNPYNPAQQRYMGSNY